MNTFAIDEIGRALGGRLGKYRVRNPLVLGLSPGGVPIARSISQSLGGELDFVQAEGIAFGGYQGAVAETGEVVLDAGGPDTVTGREFAGHISRHLTRMSARREHWFRGTRVPDVAGRLVIVVADGLASGARLRAALVSLRNRGADFLVAVAISGTDRAVAGVIQLADDTLCLLSATGMSGVGRCLKGWKRVPEPAAFRLLAGNPGLPRPRRTEPARLTSSPQPAQG